jgi:ribulose 1,5-bisphosphate synthetase/thiazole synthase
MRQIYNTDVLVVGGGPAGIGAAIGASMQGVKTTLVEYHSFLGGIASFCVGMPINQVRPSGQPRSKVHELLIQKLLNYGKVAVHIGEHQLSCNVEYLKVAIMDALDEVGCKYLLHTPAVDAIVENNRVTGIIISTKQGLAEIRAKVVVDCTGDADIAFFAGAETMKEEDALSPMTLCFNVTNVDMKKAKEFIRSGGMKDVVEKGKEKYPLLPDGWGLADFPSSNSFYINHSGTKAMGILDASDPEQLTKAETLSRRQVIQMVSAMREFGGEALEDIEIIATGPQIGVRETRRIKGEYVLTEEDAKTGSKFHDVIAWRSGFLDIGFVRFEKMKIHDVPYRAILPEKLDGLLTAGRCISATHVAASAGKSMGNCMATGHAAGIAGAMSVVQKCMPRELNVRELQDGLTKDGVDLTHGGIDQIKNAKNK